MPAFERGPTMFARDAMEIRFAHGAFADVGPAFAWFRLRVPLVAGEQPSPLQRLAAAGDFGNGIATAVSWATHVFINPDLTLYVERLPRGEWVGLDAVTRVGDAGIGVSDSALYDEHGRVGPRAAGAVRGGAVKRFRPRSSQATTAATHLSRNALMRVSYCCASRA